MKSKLIYLRDDILETKNKLGGLRDEIRNIQHNLDNQLNFLDRMIKGQELEDSGQGEQQEQSQ